MPRVRVKSQLAVDRLERHFRELVQRHSAGRKSKWSRDKRARFRQAMFQAGAVAFAVIHDNVQMGGHRWSDSLEDPEMEPRNRKLAKELDQLHIDVEQLIMRVAELRRNVPAQIKEQILRHLRAETETMIAAHREQAGQLDEQAAAAAAASEGDISSYAARIQRIVQAISKAQKDLPELNNWFAELLHIIRN